MISRIDSAHPIAVYTTNSVNSLYKVHNGRGCFIILDVYHHLEVGTLLAVLNAKWRVLVPNFGSVAYLLV